MLARSKGDLTILLLEDAADIRELIRLMLEAPGRHILTPANRAEALELARSTTIDLLVIDIVLPGLDGQKIATELGALQPGVRILYISGWYDHPEFPKLLREGVLRKPFSRETLNKAIAEVLHGRSGEPA